MRAMTPRFARYAAFAALVTACTTGPGRVDGPMRVRSQHPAQLTVMTLPAQDVGLARGEIRARWTNAYSSLFLGGSGNGNSFAMDGEYLRTALGARWGITDRLELDLELPFASTTGGFLDEFVVDWHDFFGFPNHGRDTATKDEFVVRAQRQGVTAFEVEESGFELLDVPISMAWTVLERSDANPIGVAARIGVDLPTGDQGRGYGNGGVDVAVGLVADYRFDGGAITAHLGHTFAHTPSRSKDAGLDFADVTSVGVGCEVAVFDDWNALVQVDLESSTLRDLGFARVADDQFSLWAGVRHRLAARTMVEFGIGEDLSEFIAPDFTMWFALLHRFGASE